MPDHNSAKIKYSSQTIPPPNKGDKVLIEFAQGCSSDLIVEQRLDTWDTFNSKEDTRGWIFGKIIEINSPAPHKPLRKRTRGRKIPRMHVS